MKRKIAIILTLILTAGTFTACTAEEKVNEDNKTSVVSTADVSLSEETSDISTTKQAETTTTAETETAEKATASAEIAQSKTESTKKIKSDCGQNQTKNRQNSDADSIANPKEENVKHTIANGKTSSTAQQKKEESKSEKVIEKPISKPTQKSTEKPKPAPKPTQPPAEKKNVDVSSVVSACISYGKQLGMHYDGSLNTGNASWFSPTNASYYDDTQSLISDCYSDVEYVAYYYKNDGIEPSDLPFNVVTENNKIYIVYC